MFSTTELEPFMVKGKTKPDAVPRAALPGGNVALSVDREMLEVANHLARDEYQATMQASAWGNLAILNEWKRQYPDRGASCNSR